MELSESSLEQVLSEIHKEVPHKLILKPNVIYVSAPLCKLTKWVFEYRWRVTRDIYLHKRKKNKKAVK